MKYRVGLTDTKRRRKPQKSVSRRRKYGPNPLRMKTLFSKQKKTRKPVNSRTKTKGTNPKLKEKLLKAAYIFIGVGFFIFMASIVIGGIYLKQLESSLPDPNKLVDRSSALSTQIFDKKGILLYTVHGDQNREFVKLDELQEHTKWAFLAAEDVEFYQHKGLDLLAIVRSAYNNIVLKTVTASGSTISQQLVKNTLLYDILGTEAYEKTYSRKLKEILITMQMEQNLSKDEILQLYLNEVPLGGVNYGVEAAANSYFGKSSKDLTLAESALIAGLIQSPGIYSPLFGTNPELALDRQKYVLNQMKKHKDLTGVTDEEIDAAFEEELVYRSKDIDIKAPHFVFYVKQQLVEEFGNERVEQGGLKVITTLDYSLQKIAEEEIKNGIAQYGQKWNVQNGAMIVLDPKNGDILAMVGSIDYNETDNPMIDGNVNVTISPRQMGSSVKPYTYLTAFHQGYGPWLVVPDIKELNFGNYKVQNWDNKYYGLMTAREGLLKSRNIPAIYTMQLGGIDNFIETAETLGITTLTERDRYGLSLTLGTAEMKLLEHATGFSVFANEGIKRDSRAILEVEDSKGEKLIEKVENKGKRVWDEKEIYMLNWILCDLGGFGDQPLGQYYVYNGKRAYCGKTGTTNGPRDLVSFLYHKNLVVGVWAGNNNNVETPGAWSTTVPLPIASSFMSRVASKYPSELYTRPTGVAATQVCNDSGEIPGKNTDCKKVPSIYITGKAPKPDKRESIELCTKEKVIPTNKEIANDFKLLSNFTFMHKVLENKLQQNAYEKFLSSVKNSKYIFSDPKKGECELPLGPNGAPVIAITKPANNAQYKSGDAISMEFDVAVKKTVSKIDIYFNGVLVGTKNSAPYTFTYTIPEITLSGTYVLKATITDSASKKSSDQINVKVTQSVADVSISVSAPTNGATVTLPQLITASVTGDGVTKVEFVVTKLSDSDVKTFEDNSSAGGWSVNWPSDGWGVTGSYSIKAIAYKDGNPYQSSQITVSIP